MSARGRLSATTVPNPAHPILKEFLGVMFQEEEVEEAGVYPVVNGRRRLIAKNPDLF